MELRDTIVDLIISEKPAQALHIINTWCTYNGYEQVVSQLLIPVLEQFNGSFICTDDRTAKSTLVATEIAEKTLSMVIQKTAGIIAEKRLKGAVITGSTAGDTCILGKKLVAAVLISAGWQVFDLGENINPAAFVDAAMMQHAKIIAVSAMEFETAKSIKKIRRELDNRGLSNSVFLVVVGAIFTAQTELFAEVGADLAADSAVLVPSLLEKLFKEIGEAVE